VDYLKIAALDFAFWFFPTALCFGVVFFIAKKALKRVHPAKRVLLLFGMVWALLAAASFICGIEQISGSINGWGILLFPIFLSVSILFAEPKIFSISR
jgi:hypothetical protein